jgi:hypothetical protein
MSIEAKALARLPVWARKHIADLEKKLATAEEGDHMTFRTIELRDANGDLVCEEPIKQPMDDEPAMFATFNGRLFFLCGREPDDSVARYVERHALRCGRAVIHDGQISAWRDGVPDGPDFVLACVESDRGRRTVIRASYARQYVLVSHLVYVDENCDYHEEKDEYYVPEGWYEPGFARQAKLFEEGA